MATQFVSQPMPAVMNGVKMSMRVVFIKFEACILGGSPAGRFWISERYVNIKPLILYRIFATQYEINYLILSLTRESLFLLSRSSLGSWCNGSTSVFGTVSRGSNPCEPATFKDVSFSTERLFSLQNLQLLGHPIY